MINPIPLVSLHWQNYFDIFIVAAMVYSLYIWLKGTRALQILAGLAGLGMLYFIASWSGLFLTSWLLQYLLGVILVLAIVIFQPEIRQLLERVSALFIRQRGVVLQRTVLTEITDACFYLASHRTGALLVFPRNAPVAETVRDGVVLDSLVTQALLVTIFQKSSPIHDGAVIIENGRITRAGCYLPLSIREGLPAKYGTRHRAALGIVEAADAVCVVVSEERGAVSLVQQGYIEPISGEHQLLHLLEEALMPPSGVRPALRSMIIESIKSRFNYQEFIRQNLAAKFLALGFSFLLWFMLVGQEWSETFASAKLEYRNIPQGLDITSEPVSDIHVRVRGPRGSIATLAPGRVRMRVDLTDVTPGTHVIQLSAENLDLPFGLEATSIEPAALTMQFDRIVTRRFKVDEEFTGELPEGVQLVDVVISPNPVELRGPAGDLDQIVKVTTSPIDLSGITTTRTIRCQVKIIPLPSSARPIPAPEVMVTLHLAYNSLKNNPLKQPLSIGNDKEFLAAEPVTYLNVW